MAATARTSGPQGHRSGPGGGRASQRGIDILGIPVRADASLLLIAALLGWSFWLRYSAASSRWGALLMALVATGLFLGSVLLHELAHAIEARRRGVEVRDITLYVFGGATRMTDEAPSAGDEFALTAAGPWSSIVLGCGFGLLATAADHLGAPAVGRVAGELGWLNLVLGLFNLLPGAPLDGGRILDSIVWRITGDRARAARVSAVSGQAIGAALVALGVAEILFVLGGFVSGLWLALIGWFLLHAAGVERRLAGVSERLRGRRVADVTPPIAAVPADVPIEAAGPVLGQAGPAGAVAVAGPDGIIGVVTGDDLRRVPADERPLRTVEEVMTPLAALSAVQATAPATELLALLGSRPVAVLDGDRVQSLVTPDQLDAVLTWLPPVPSQAADADRRSRSGSREARGSTAGRHRGSIAATAVLAASGVVVVAAAGIVPMPLVEVSPGPTFDVPALLRTGGPVHPLGGRLLLTSVQLDAPSLLATATAVFDPHREILRQPSVVPAGIDQRDYGATQRQLFLDSVQLGAAVALRAAGYPVSVTGGGAVVRAVDPGGPAAGLLLPGDVIVGIAGHPVVSASDLVARLSTVPAGSVSLDVRRGDRTLTVRVATTWSTDLGRAALGIAVEDASPLVQLPFAVQLDQPDLGGPSGGLMTALTVYSVTTGTDLTGGKTVAGTGTIDADGNVGPIGGIAEKVAAASAAGASLMLVPAAQADAARRGAQGLPIRVVPVSSFSDAVEQLRSAGR